MSESPDTRPGLSGLRLWTLTLLTLVAFAGNSLFCRAALSESHIDAMSFTFVRLAAGLLMLAIIVGSSGRASRRGFRGTWSVGGILVAYAILFSLAYEHISAGVGALVLFGTVQLTMLTSAVRAGAGPRGWAWLGVAIALAGLSNLTLPGAGAPSTYGLLLMAGSGIFWGLYSLAGARSSRPVLSTAANFNRATLIALPFALLTLLRGAAHADAYGLTMAVASGAIASGLGYVLWYAVLPALGATRGSVLQLAIPVIAALGGALLLGEAVSMQVIVSSMLILGGIGVVLAVGSRPGATNAHPESPYGEP